MFLRRRMTVPNQKTQEALGWNDLPAEIRLMILSNIADLKYPGWASQAAVCQEWQHELEKANFRKLTLTVSCLDEFETIVSPRIREFIHHINLHVELPQYRTLCCSTNWLGELAGPRTRKDGVFGDGICRLWSILSKWGPSNYLALEINAYSPTDSQHWFSKLHFASDDVEDDGNPLPGPYHDSSHGWESGRKVANPPNCTLIQLFQPLTALGEKLPRIQAVTHFIIRRQLRRSIFGHFLRKMLKSLVRLEQVSYEPWAPYFMGKKRAIYDIGTYRCVLDSNREVHPIVPSITVARC